MSGKLYMLTPISSPMVTRPTSPTAGDAAGAHSSSAFFEDSTAMLNGSNPGSSRFAKLSSSFFVETPATADCSPFAVAAMQAARSDSPQGDPAAQPTDSCSTSTSSGQQQQQQARWRSPPCCSSCGAAKADGGSCSGCGGRFCKACMLPDNNSSSRSGGLLGVAKTSAKAGRSGLGGSCSNCSSLCNACKPITCSFCEPGNGLAAAARMCEACAGTCDSCKRAACDPCAASFAACSSCGYATCEECTLQMRMGREAGVGAAAAGAGCWCAPPLRSASNVRHISSQRYQLSQLHPSVLASSMQAAGLRDPEDYDEFENDYDDFDYDFEFNPATSSSVMNAAAAFDALARGNNGGFVDKKQQQRPDLQQQLDADVLAAHHRHWAGAGSGSSDRFHSAAGLDAKSLGAVLGAIGSLGGSMSGAYGLASPGSSHSSGSHMLQGSYQGSFAAAAAAAAGGSSPGYQQQQQQQQQQRAMGGGTGAAAVVAAAAAGVGARREVGCV